MFDTGFIATATEANRFGKFVVVVVDELFRHYAKTIKQGERDVFTLTENRESLSENLAPVAKTYPNEKRQAVKPAVNH